MAGAEWARWVFAAMFAALTLFYLARLYLPGHARSLRGAGETWSVDAARGVMSLGMTAMLVPWVDPLPRVGWQLLFGIAAVHGALRLIQRWVRPVPGTHHELHLAIGAVAMVYMLVAMPDGHAMAPGGMSGMPGMAPVGPALPWLTWAFVAYFLFFAVWLGRHLVTPSTAALAVPASAPFSGGGPRSVAVSPHLLGSTEVVMCIGMSYMLLAML
ncbi:MAG: DUF5134 domain-containing protein [Pseudonocardiaceae bacterium]